MANTVIKLKFLGGAGTVTGSKYLLSIANKRILVDCGLFQGVKNQRQQNWSNFPVDPQTIDCILLTHAHIDHSGYIPALVKQGFRGRVYCTTATHELCAVLLPDAGFLQQEDARHANKHGYSRHKPTLPLYTEEDAYHALQFFVSCDYHQDIELFDDIKVVFSPVGHILGSAAITVKAANRKIVFSGDVGRQNDVVMKKPEPLEAADYLVIESTYGNRLHGKDEVLPLLTQIINRTLSRGGIVLVPAFAVGRTQTVLHLIQQLKDAGDISANVPVYLNSPMAIRATEIYCRHHQEHLLTRADCNRLDRGTRFVRTVEESIALNQKTFPAIIASASGMVSGGRVLHHLKSLVSDHRNSIVFLGFQAPGTRGEAMVNGTETIKIHGRYFPVKADLYHLDNLSAHGDYKDILAWLTQSDIHPKQVFVTHGEPAAADSMRLKLQDQFGWNSCVPLKDEEYTL